MAFISQYSAWCCSVTCFWSGLSDTLRDPFFRLAIVRVIVWFSGGHSGQQVGNGADESGVLFAHDGPGGIIVFTEFKDLEIIREVVHYGSSLRELLREHSGGVSCVVAELRRVVDLAFQIEYRVHPEDHFRNS